MCIVIDTNTLSKVFDPSNALHADFKPVFDWIISGNGKIVYGGTKYFHEAFVLVRRFNPLFEEFRRRGKLIVAPTEEVDAAEARIRAAEPAPGFDDPHIVAIIDVTGCVLLCSGDKRSDKYIKRSSLYHQSSRPKIYREARYHKKLLCDSHIATCCKPAECLSGRDAEGIRTIVSPT